MWQLRKLFPPHLTIADRARHRDNNFTLIRLIAAYAVLFAHSYGLALGRPGQDAVTRWVKMWWGQSLGELAVTVFFVVSGFLVGGSYLHRNNALTFVEARVLRIFPALFLAVLLSVFVVGWYATTMDKIDYLRSPVIWDYVRHNLWLLGGVKYQLPGVFEGNPRTSAVNGSLWTLPLELRMYIMVLILGVVGILKRQHLFNFLAVALVLVFLAKEKSWLTLPPLYSKHLYLVVAYIVGMFLYVNRKHIPLNVVVLTTVVTVMLVFHDTSLWMPVKIMGLGYVLLFIALHPAVRLPNLDRWGDISYGVYVFAFPIQQLIVKDVTRSPLEVLLYSTLVVVPLSMMSWHFVEKPALRLKGKLPRAISGSIPVLGRKTG